MLHEVSIAGLTMDPATNTPIVVLKTLDESHSIPIWIGLLEATSIASAIQNVTFERPMTHDLFKNFLELRKTLVTKIEVCDIKDNTFYARIHFAAGEESFSMDARPSDAIAIALRFHAPIFVDDKVIEKYGGAKTPETDEPVEVADESEEGKKWADYLENLSPDDFNKFKI